MELSAVGEVWLMKERADRKSADEAASAEESAGRDGAAELADSEFTPDATSPAWRDFAADLEASALGWMRRASDGFGHGAVYYWHRAAFDGIADGPATAKRMLSIQRILAASMMAYTEKEDGILRAMSKPALVYLEKHAQGEPTLLITRPEAATWLWQFILQLLLLSETLSDRSEQAQVTRQHGLIEAESTTRLDVALGSRDREREVAAIITEYGFEFVGVAIAGELRDAVRDAFDDPAKQAFARDEIYRILRSRSPSTPFEDTAREIARKMLGAMGLPAAKGLYDFERNKPRDAPNWKAAESRMLSFFQALSESENESPGPPTLRHFHDAPDEDLDRAAADCDEALRRFELSDDCVGQADAHLLRGDLRRLHDDLDGAAANYEDALRLFGLGESRRGQAIALLAHGNLRRDLDCAAANYEDALRLFGLVDDLPGQANVLLARGDLRRCRKDLNGAAADYDKAFRLFHFVNDRPGQANVLFARGDLERAQENPPAARVWYDLALPMYRAMSSSVGLSNVLAELARLYAFEGDGARAAERATEAQELARRSQNRYAFNLASAVLEELNGGTGGLETLPKTGIATPIGAAPVATTLVENKGAAAAGPGGPTDSSRTDEAPRRDRAGLRQKASGGTKITDVKDRGRK